TTGNVLTVHPSVPARSVRELLQLAKSKPGTLNYGSAGIGTKPHIAGELFNYLGKVNLTVVHFKGGAPALVGVMGGEVGITFTSVLESAPHVGSGRLRAPGVTGLKRSPALPDVPPIAEAALPGYEFVGWHVLVAPKGTPAAAVALLSDTLRK